MQCVSAALQNPLTLPRFHFGSLRDRLALLLLAATRAAGMHQCPRWG